MQNPSNTKKTLKIQMKFRNQMVKMYKIIQLKTKKMIKITKLYNNNNVKLLKISEI